MKFNSGGAFSETQQRIITVTRLPGDRRRQIAGIESGLPDQIRQLLRAA